MPEIFVTPLYASAIALLMAVLSTRVAMMRGKHRAALGDGGNAELALCIRRFGNLAEYAAMAVLLLLLMELKGIDDMWLHTYGATLVILRLIHPFVLFDHKGAPLWKKAGRFLSGAGTALLLVAGAATLMLT